MASFFILFRFFFFSKQTVKSKCSKQIGLLFIDCKLKFPEVNSTWLFGAYFKLSYNPLQAQQLDGKLPS